MRRRTSAKPQTIAARGRSLLGLRSAPYITLTKEGAEDEKEVYDSRLLDVTRALEEVESPGDCFTSGSYSSFPLPGLIVDELGEVRFPLGEDGAKQLITKCHLAPYGHGEATIVDTAVRNTWELHASQFQLSNPTWRDQIDLILKTIRTPLGIHETTEFDAKLYKMLLYEEGGKFHKHQDSEKETGMFGTLVVMLPCRFEGGELLVNHPTRAATQNDPYVWDPAGMNAYDLKYAAFYGDCEHEVKPVTSGYRLCLTYNLVTITTTRVPRFAGNHALYQRLETSLQAFFQESEEEKEQTQQKNKKRQRLSTSRVAPQHPQQRDCQLVYVLEHKYTNPGLSFAYLKNKDHAVAQSFAKFCDDSRGAYGLYLCKIKYTLEYDPDCDEPEYHDKTVRLQSPWVKYGDLTAVPCDSMTANLTSEVAPAKFFEEVPFDGSEDHGYTGNAGSRMEKWYSSAALVIQPLKIELQQTARAGMDYAVNKWIKLVESESPHAQTFAATVFADERRWSTKDACFLPCLKAVRRLKSVDVLGDVLHSLSNIEFHEAIGNAVNHFGWNQCRDLIWEVAEASTFRNRVNLICSVLHSVNSIEDEAKNADTVARITEVLTRVDVKPTLDSNSDASRFRSYYPYGEAAVPVIPTAEEYARVLSLACRVSVDTLRGYVETSETNALVKLVAPALASFVQSHQATGTPLQEPLVEIVKTVVTQLQTRMPPASSWDLSHIRVPGSCCQHCAQLQMFLSSRTQQTLRMPMKKADRHHIHKVIEMYAGNRLSHQTDRPITLVVTKLLPTVDLHDKAQHALQQLRAIVGVGNQEEESNNRNHPSRTMSIRDIIEIDCSDSD